MKTMVYEFKQEVLGLSYLNSIKEIEYKGRNKFIDEKHAKVILTSEEDMTSFEKMIFEEYQENEFDYQPTLTGDLF
jgi:hypothetical protein